MARKKGALPPFCHLEILLSASAPHHGPAEMKTADLQN
ncbi:hypothetical protein YSA_02580 [Pseudomonas putida ND6]|uniref:Uncharacterized protein n=1 Tax=Pseudomonas putida ND6 TaxID=231023 RepID=I3URP9_PSEPU|nr:hypothetical protein YSA_02580 [Pseudomonas putida ND6]